MKYIARPCDLPPKSQAPVVTDTYLTDALRERLQKGDACFDFGIQFQTDARKMPIEDATVEWKEADSPWHIVARIRIPPQGISGGDEQRVCEESAFNPWNCIADHRPLGGMNRSRQEIYRAMAEFRRSRQGR